MIKSLISFELKRYKLYMYKCGWEMKSNDHNLCHSSSKQDKVQWGQKF